MLKDTLNKVRYSYYFWVYFQAVNLAVPTRPVIPVVLP